MASSAHGCPGPSRSKRLVKLMLRGCSDVSGAYEDKYLHAIDLIRKHRGLGP